MDCKPEKKVKLSANPYLPHPIPALRSAGQGQTALESLDPAAIVVTKKTPWGPHGYLASVAADSRPILLQLPPLSSKWGVKFFGDKPSVAVDLESCPPVLLNYFRALDHAIKKIVSDQGLEWYPNLHPDLSLDQKRTIVGEYYNGITRPRQKMDGTPQGLFVNLKIDQKASTTICPVAIYDAKKQKVDLDAINPGSIIRSIIWFQGLFIGEKSVTPQIFLLQAQVLHPGASTASPQLNEFAMMD